MQVRGNEGLEVSSASSLLVRLGGCGPVIGAISPQVDGGPPPAKADGSDAVVVEADVFADGHDVVVCTVRFRHDEALQWSSAPMDSGGNGSVRARFDVTAMVPTASSSTPASTRS